MKNLVISRVAKPKLTEAQTKSTRRALRDEIYWAWAFPLPYGVLKLTPATTNWKVAEWVSYRSSN